jgi:Flagellar motor protein
LPKKIKRNINELKIPDPEHNTGADRYLITYADLITLLLGLFVILYAASQVDRTKFSALSAALSQYFNPKTGKILEKGEGELSGGRGVLPAPEFL